MNASKGRGALGSILLAGALLAGSCKGKSGEATQTGSNPPAEAPQVSEPVVSEPSLEAPTAPAETASFATASNTLAFELYQGAAKEPGNLVFSPVSIAVAFAMTYAGASGETAEEMRRVLHLPEGDDVHYSASSLLHSWINKGLSLNVVNRLFGEASYTFERAFTDRLTSTYVAPIESLDFKGNPEAQRAVINNWVMRQTENRIDDLLPEGSVRADTRLVLVNAIYFRGTWADTFEARHTADKAFVVDGGKSVMVPMMAQTRHYKYAEQEGFRALELPYKDGSLVMDILLPNTATGLPALEATMNHESMQALWGKLAMENVALELPRFELKNARIKLAAILKELGMISAFDPRSANFLAMAAPASPDEQLYIADAFHEAYTKVDETGTEAAAATAAVMGTKGAAPAPPKAFHVKHPFAFVIRDTESGAILFMGRVSDPS